MVDPLSNPTLHPRALTEHERDPDFKWHTHSQSPRSSQAFCLSAFGTLRSIDARDRILEGLFRHAFPGFPRRNRPRRWSILPEADMRTSSMQLMILVPRNSPNSFENAFAMLSGRATQQEPRQLRNS